MTPNQLQYRELYTHLADLIRLELDAGDEADRIREELSLAWRCMDWTEREPFFAPECLERSAAQAGSAHG